MYGSSAGNGAASGGSKAVPADRRRKMLNKRRGVAPQAILCSVLLCGAAFAYALSVTDDDPDSRGSVVAELTDPDTEFSIGSAQATEQKKPAVATPVAPLPERSARVQARPAEKSTAVLPIETTDPRFAQDVEPVSDGFDWEGRMAVSENGDDIITVEDRSNTRTANPLIQRKAEAPELAYAQPSAGTRSEKDDVAAPRFDVNELVDARTRSAVNMRASGKKSASVITVVPRGAAVRVAQDCQHWCPTVYENQSGYIYKTYITLVDMRSTASVPPTEAADENSQSVGPEQAGLKAEDYIRKHAP